MDPDPSSIDYILASVQAAFSEYGPVFLAITVLLLLSGLVSSCEIAYFSLTQADLEDIQESGEKKSHAILELIKKPRKLLATILILNNLVNVAIILISSIALRKFAASYADIIPTWVVVFTEIGVITFILLFFGEITPKVAATKKKMTIVRSAVIINMLRISGFIFSPLSYLLINFSSLIDKRISMKSDTASFEDIKTAIDLTSEDESPEEEKEILKGIVKFSSTYVKAIMTPRVNVRAIEATSDFEEVVRQINDLGFSRIPVYEESVDNVKGILYIKDLLPLLKNQPENPRWTLLMRDPYFVPEHKKIDDLLEEFKAKRLHIAVVVDEFGGMAGIVTLEDIIEEIFGEINDEFDTDELVYSRLSDQEYVFDGKTPLNDLIRITGLHDQVFDEWKGESDSLAGLILEIHGKIPERGELIEKENFKFFVESVGQNRIKRVKMVMEESEENLVTDE